LVGFVFVSIIFFFANCYNLRINILKKKKKKKKKKTLILERELFTSSRPMLKLKRSSIEIELAFKSFKT